MAFHSGCEADHSPPSGADVKECVELYLHFSNTPSWRGAQLGEHRDNFLHLILFPSFQLHAQLIVTTFLHLPNNTDDL
jgi:hypothetical protein